MFFSQKYPAFLLTSFVPLICKEMSDRFIGKEMSVICWICWISERFSQTELVTDFRNDVVQNNCNSERFFLIAHVSRVQHGTVRIAMN